MAVAEAITRRADNIGLNTCKRTTLEGSLAKSSPENNVRAGEGVVITISDFMSPDTRLRAKGCVGNCLQRAHNKRLASSITLSKSVGPLREGLALFSEGISNGNSKTT